MVYQLLILALALSVDAFGIGLTLGVRGIRISNGAKVIISCQAISITFLALVLGDILRKLLPYVLSKYLGTLLLIFLGVWIIFQSKKKQKPRTKKLSSSANLCIFIKNLGITIQIIRTPQTCDLDKSETIDTLEALYLGFALSIDAFGAVTGAGIIGGFTRLLPFTVALLQILLLALGMHTGKLIKSLYCIDESLWTFASGILLIAIGLIYLF
jgi:putative sporulation protein YtaF